MRLIEIGPTEAVIPAQAGIQKVVLAALDLRLRRGDAPDFAPAAHPSIRRYAATQDEGEQAAPSTNLILSARLSRVYRRMGDMLNQLQSGVSP